MLSFNFLEIDLRKLDFTGVAGGVGRRDGSDGVATTANVRSATYSRVQKEKKEKKALGQKEMMRKRLKVAKGLLTNEIIVQRSLEKVEEHGVVHVPRNERSGMSSLHASGDGRGRLWREFGAGRCRR